MQYVNNKGADQPAHPRSLISTFVFHCLDIIHLVSSFYIHYFKPLTSVAVQAGLSLPWSQTSDRFSSDEAQIRRGSTLVKKCHKEKQINISYKILRQTMKIYNKCHL